MKLFIVMALTVFIGGNACCQSAEIQEQHTFQFELLQKYQKLRATPQEHAHLTGLKSLPFFPFDSTLRVRAILDTTGSSGFLPMKTSLGRFAFYRRYGYLIFTLAGRSFRMPVYQAKPTADAHSGELFFPFTDKTNGESTYGGGRYIDLRVPGGTKLVLDFNRAYNPYCAYSHRYSCEIPPEENHFPIAIEAGVKY